MATTMLADVRRRRLTERLVERGSITVRECAEEFGVTTETIRKDILHLESVGIAQKTFGGAVVAAGFTRMRTPAETSHIEAKNAIAARALELVPENASVFIDGGTTTLPLGEKLALRDDLTIFTNSVPLLAPLTMSRSEVFVIGGRLHAPGMSSVGRWAVNAVQSTSIDIAFLGTDGHHGAPGPTSASYEESEFKAAVILASRRAVVLSDSSKFYTSGLFTFSNWRDIQVLITDEAITEPDHERLSAATEVVIAHTPLPDDDRPTV